MQYFRQRFQQQLSACPDAADTTTCAVPRFNEMVMPNNHTAGTGPGTRSPDALVRDTDQAIGQLVGDVSKSKIWPYTAIFVIPDDAQGGSVVDRCQRTRITVGQDVRARWHQLEAHEVSYNQTRPEAD